MHKMIRYFKDATQYGDVLFSIAVVLIISILLIPIPANVMDFLFSLSISISISILVTVLFVAIPLEFSSFPSILLIATMLRLALNIASTRLILSKGHLGTDAAGSIIEAFGQFVMQGSLVIGAIVFIILTIINFIVITKGSGRIAEVSARFSLDSIPGKQMSIDADLASGAIDEQTARERRKTVERESTFFGAMDGASKFVRGDAIAGILITFVNFVAGMIIGIAQRNMTISHAAHTYTILTIGDGLISQIPALIISVAAGLLVTKSADIGSTDKVIFAQLSKYPKSISVTSLFLFLIGIMPGMPLIPFFILSGITGCASYFLWTANTQKPKLSTLDASEDPQIIKSQEEASIIKDLKIDNIRVELGLKVIPMTNALSVGIKTLRKQIAQDMGFITPPIRICDEMSLEDEEYVIKIQEVKCAQGTVKPQKMMIISPAGKPIHISGEPAKEPVFGIEAMWIDQDQKHYAEASNFTIIEPNMVIVTHVGETIKENLSNLLSYSATKNLLDNLGEEHRQLIADNIPAKLEVSTLQSILQKLLSERISIRNLPLIIESILKIIQATQDVSKIVNHVRSSLALQISYTNTNDNGYIPVVNLSGKWEERFHSGIVDGRLTLPPSQIQEFITNLKDAFEKFEVIEDNPVLVTSASVRPFIRSVVERFKNNLTVLAQNEIHHKAKVRQIGII